jgi:cyclase
MLRKRVAGVITVKGGWAVQSFGYGRYLPLGRPEILAENLDRWGADEIVIQCIDRTMLGLGPDLALLERVSRRGLATPLIYGGGIRNADDAVAVVKAGADRVCLDALLRDAPGHLETVAARLGAQAVIAALPLSTGADGQLAWLDYRTRNSTPFDGAVIDLLGCGAISEALIIDWQNEGYPASFDARLLARFPIDDIPLIAFGGLSEPGQIRGALESPRVCAVAIGNFLNYSEHAIHAFKVHLGGLPIRPPMAIGMSI